MPEAVPAFVWVEQLVAPGARLVLDETATHHVARVCRARSGDHVTVTDGRGGLARGRVTELVPRVSLELEDVKREERSAIAVLLCGAPDGQRFDWLVEKVAELGIARLRPIESARGTWSRTAVRPDRWRRLAIAAIEQSRGRYLLEVALPMPLEDAVETEGEIALGVMADPDGVAPRGITRPATGTTVGVVGPAGGLSDTEKSTLVDHGFLPMSLAPGRLRTETAALSWSAWWAAPR